MLPDSWAVRNGRRDPKLLGLVLAQRFVAVAKLCLEQKLICQACAGRILIRPGFRSVGMRFGKKLLNGVGLIVLRTL